MPGSEVAGIHVWRHRSLYNQVKTGTHSASRPRTPPQTVRVLASTTVPETWVVSTGGCVATDPAGCSDSRGVVFSPNASSTWDNIGNFALDVEKNLRNYSSNWDHGNYGFETLALGYLGSDGPTVESSVIAGLNTKDFYLGSIGLSPQPLNFTATDNPAPSLLGSLKIGKRIPSLSYGYSAGAQYRLKKVLGSLTLGGYDASRRPPNDTITFTFGDDISRDLLVGLQSIEYSDTKTAGRQLLSEGILTFIDSTVPHIWLPLSACKAFESAFGLQYDNTTDLYLVNSTLHDALTKQNASISFVLGNHVQGGETVNITFPYASFDLQVSSPIVSEPTRYFPLRRADNDTQYTLGRTFLQESYLTVDYERSRFSVSQARFDDGAVADLISIVSPNETSAAATASGTGSDGFSRGALAGTVGGAVAFFFLVVGAISLLFWKRRRRRRVQEEAVQEAVKEPETDSGSSRSIIGGELNTEFGDGKYRPPEVEGSAGSRGKLVEAEGNHGGIEMEGTGGGAELHGSGGVAEMEGKGARAELDAVHVYELPAGEVKAKVPRSESGQERIRIAKLGRLRRKEQRNE
ncbi:MAG: hypothetical protein L6R38_006597 [Xanthoria sp. 2 TBL-2021]|nr:MAG: hypothetical protein L6R38_006597 [Xanthoria sp. 2 TBL-2021]